MKENYSKSMFFGLMRLIRNPAELFNLVSYGRILLDPLPANYRLL